MPGQTECKYCGKVAKQGQMCGLCRNKHQLVKKLVKSFEPYRKVAQKRKEDTENDR